jgi:signal peptidase II
MIRFNQKWRWLAGIAGTVVILDQLSKAVVRFSLPLYQSVPVISGFFSLTHIENPGGAFGFLAGHQSSLQRLFFLIGTLAAVGVLIYLYKKIPATYSLLAAGLALIMGGALGNLMDRIRFGKVTDFLDFFIGHLHWPAFNVADSAVTVGGVIFIYHLIFRKMPDG